LRQAWRGHQAGFSLGKAGLGDERLLIGAMLLSLRVKKGAMGTRIVSMLSSLPSLSCLGENKL